MKIGIVGAGHLGKIHIKCANLVEGLEVVGFYDINPVEIDGLKCFLTLEALINAVDIVDIVTPTPSHFEIAEKAILAGKHVFIEKPVTHTLAQAEKLIKLQKEKKVKIQIGHVERFNPALQSLDLTNISPKFVEIHRLASFNPRGNDVSVVFDLMIHDLDIILHLIQSPVREIRASGVGVINPTPDIANVRLEFENGCVVNLTASRISLKQMRKIRMFQADAYISIDLLEKQSQIIRLVDEKPEAGFLTEWNTPEGEKYIQAEMPEIPSTNAIKVELESFMNCILKDTLPKVSLADGYKALQVAFAISEQIEDNMKQIKGE
ncbi:MAG: Gfo/Idh/MocA family protein [Saprospiraceae bacterium]